MVVLDVDIPEIVFPVMVRFEFASPEEIAIPRGPPEVPLI